MTRRITADGIGYRTPELRLASLDKGKVVYTIPDNLLKKPLVPRLGLSKGPNL